VLLVVKSVVKSVVKCLMPLCSLKARPIWFVSVLLSNRTMVVHTMTREDTGVATYAGVC
jgi:hypothetical protein